VEVGSLPLIVGLGLFSSSDVNFSFWGDVEGEYSRPKNAMFFVENIISLEDTIEPSLIISFYKSGNQHVKR
jgi:hypothetical protein